ncbi:MAG TPA: SDR family oxidoreductase [Micromonosporaceae bacterium]
MVAPAPVAVVTGAGSGIGLAIARELSSRGYRVLLTDVDKARLAEAAAPLGGWAERLDVRDGAACAAIAAQAADQPGGLALWVNNAGILATGPSWTHGEDTRRRVVEVNALGAMNGTLAALDVMRSAGRGHVINIVSLAGLIAAPGETVYAASKHALLAFSLGTLADLRAAGELSVHISCLCPDGVWSPMLYDKLTDDGAAASFTGTLLLPEQVARRVAWLAAHPRPVLALPRWRGAQVRLLAAFPRLSIPATRLVLGLGRARQRRYAARIAAGRWP